MLDVSILTNVWYALIINFNQRKGEISFKLYRRNTTIGVTLYHPKTYEMITLDYDTEQSDIQYEINTNGFKPINNTETLVVNNDSEFILMNSVDINFTDTYSSSYFSLLWIVLHIFLNFF